LQCSNRNFDFNHFVLLNYYFSVTTQAQAWLINTGWTGGAYGTGHRISLTHTRALIDRIHNGSLQHAKFSTLPAFGLQYVSEVEGIPRNILNPREAWKDANAYDAALQKLAKLFSQNFGQYADRVVPSIKSAGPN
jgi:phosphoenolpyruvate carboxykinase (ATP)